MASVINKIENSCFAILSNIRSSKLNYSIQETPYSIYLTIRKSIRKSPTFSNPEIQSFSPPGTISAVLELKKENELLLNKCQFLERSNQELKNSFEEATNENETNLETIHNLEDKIEILNNKLVTAEKEVDFTVGRKIKAVTDEKRLLQTKHEKICTENKTLKKEKEDFCKEISTLKVSLKSSRKETKDVVKNFEKKISEYETKITDLLSLF